MTHIEVDLGLHPRQLQAFESAATEQLFGGATEGGKSHFARVLLISACLSVPQLQCSLVRKKFSDILANHVNGPTGFRALLKDLLEAKVVEVTNDHVKFKNGSIITFVHCQDERQFDSAQGVEKHILVIDEATQISERLIRFFRGWVRMPKEFRATLPADWKNKLPCILYTANPIGTSVPFFKRKFVDARPHESIEEVEGFKRQYMLSRYTDNPSIDEDAHRGRMAGIGDTRIAKALDDGDWNAITGEFFPEWDEDRHVIKESADLTLPYSWYRFRGLDLGYAEPFAVYWVAVSDGEVFRDNLNRERWFPRGAFIIYNEWYGCDPGDPSKGLRMRNEDIAAGIIARSELGKEKAVTLTDSLPFQDRGGEGPVLTFRKNGVELTLGDTSRVTGWNAMRSRLIGIPYDGKRIPMIYFTERCKYARDYIPALPRHPSESKKEDAAEHGEATHAPDTIRIISMAHTVIKDNVHEITNEMIQKTIKSNKPTIKNITRSMGNAYFR